MACSSSALWHGEWLHLYPGTWAVCCVFQGWHKGLHSLYICLHLDFYMKDLLWISLRVDVYGSRSFSVVISQKGLPKSQIWFCRLSVWKGRQPKADTNSTSSRWTTGTSWKGPGWCITQSTLWAADPLFTDILGAAPPPSVGLLEGEGLGLQLVLELQLIFICLLYQPFLSPLSPCQPLWWSRWFTWWCDPGGSSERPVP